MIIPVFSRLIVSIVFGEGLILGEVLESSFRSVYICTYSDNVTVKLRDGNGREKRSALELLDRPDKSIIPYEVSLIVGIAE
ncbi:hypothetical protein V6N12_015167 [Hibiscus sabdariffa]|uniref:Uncharacterized protein n=1 Tax=Hibiscus sabdariffa TaxID=183260 RepID=A0ABR2DMT2_9ROSI